MKRVLVFVNQRLKQDPTKGGRPHPLLGGLTTAERVAYGLAKSGARRSQVTVTFVGANEVREVLSRTPGPDLEMNTQRDWSPETLFSRASAEAQADTEAGTDLSTPLLLIRGDRLYGNEVLSQALSLTPKPGEVLALSDADNKTSSSPESTATMGILAATPEALSPLLQESASTEESEAGDPNDIVHGLERAAHSAGTLCTVPKKAGYWHPAETRSHWKPARDALFSSLGKPIDGFISRHFNRPVSQFFSKRLCNLPITPNQISAIVFLIGLGAAALMATGQWLWIALSAVVFHMASVLDGVDGEIARVKYQSSKFGALLDSILDHIVMVAWILAAGYVLTTLRGEGFLWMGAAYVCLFCTAVGSAMVNYDQVTKTRGGQPMELKWDFEKEENKDRLSSRIINAVRFFVSRDVDCVVLGLLAALNFLKPVVMISSVVSVVYFFVVLGHQLKRLFTRPQAVTKA